MKTEEIDALMGQLFAQARAQFGSAIKGFWFYELDPCPGCGSEIDAVKFKGKNSLSLNAFIYRPRGVLIGYFLCSQCVTKLIQAGNIAPGKPLPLHETIEANLIKAYLKQLQ